MICWQCCTLSQIARHLRYLMPENFAFAPTRTTIQLDIQIRGNTVGRKIEKKNKAKAPASDGSGEIAD
jgi:hypothetical protein